MAEEQADRGVRALSDAAPSAVNLQIVSPNVGISPFMVPALSTLTTVRQLKELIRQRLPSNPPLERQRLIYRGGALTRDNASLEDIFTNEQLRSESHITLHLVVREADGQQTPAPSLPQLDPLHARSPAHRNAPTPPNSAQNHNRLRALPPGFIPPPGFVPPPGYAVPASPSPARTLPPMPEPSQQTDRHGMRQLIEQMHRDQLEAAHRHIQMQQQHFRAAAGTQGTQDGSSGVRGDRGRVLSAADVANIMRGADPTQAAQTISAAMTGSMAGAMHRNTPGALPANVLDPANFNGPVQPIQPGVSRHPFDGTPIFPSREAIPNMHGRALHLMQNPPAPTLLTPPAPLPGTPDVYILSSAAGPRGLLINSRSDIYMAPTSGQTSIPPPLAAFANMTRNLGQAMPLHDNRFAPWQQAPPQVLRVPQAPPPTEQPPPAAQPQQPAPQVQVQVRMRRAPPQAPAQAPPQAPAQALAAHPNNPGAGALVAAAWPHIWLVIRLVLFVWWFTTGDTSWSRWLTMVAIAIGVFVLNTGMLNGFVNQVWDPFRQHLEGLIPLEDPNRLQRNEPPAPPAQPAAPNGAAAAAGTTTDMDRAPTQLTPAQTAARLVAGRRNANANWLLDQVRRLERAGLLFLASIAPGVAERHIAHIAEQERTERQRRDDQEAAAAAEAAAVANEEPLAHEEGSEQREEQTGREVVGADARDEAARDHPRQAQY